MVEPPARNHEIAIEKWGEARPHLKRVPTKTLTLTKWSMSLDYSLPVYEIPSRARFLFQLIMRRKRAGAVKGKEERRRERGGIYDFTHKLADELF